jgi:hypothetical protein
MPGPQFDPLSGLNSVSSLSTGLAAHASLCSPGDGSARARFRDDRDDSAVDVRRVLPARIGIGCESASES